jgi:hypothetical protein
MSGLRRRRLSLAAPLPHLPSTSMLQNLLAGLGLMVCAALLVRMVLDPMRQARWDRYWSRQFGRVRTTGRWLQRQWMLLRTHRQARQQAEQAIHTARKGQADAARKGPVDAERKGNVIRPRAFRKDDDEPPTLH